MEFEVTLNLKFEIKMDLRDPSGIEMDLGSSDEIRKWNLDLKSRMKWNLDSRIELDLKSEI
jgi:hypothetical protein